MSTMTKKINKIIAIDNSTEDGFSNYQKQRISFLKELIALKSKKSLDEHLWEAQDFSRVILHREIHDIEEKFKEIGIFDNRKNISEYYRVKHEK